MFQFGSLVNGITNTARKAVTLALSFALFPERNTLEFHHIFGGCIFFCGLIVRTVMKDNSEKTEMNKSNTQKNKENEKILSQILPEVNFSVSERDYFITVENLNNKDNDDDNNGEVDVEKGRRKTSENEIENGTKYYPDNGIKNNYIPINNTGNGHYNGHQPISVYETNSRNYDVRKNQVSENLKQKSLHDNIHYNGIHNIIVNPHSPPLSRKNQTTTTQRAVNGRSNGFEEMSKSGISDGERLQENIIMEKRNNNEISNNDNYRNNRNTLSPVFLNGNSRNGTIKNSRTLNTPTIV